jgi:hypothetical protein
MIKMVGYGFPAPWLNGRPIDAPNKIDMIDWYSQTDGYYPEATEHGSRNNVLRIFRSQGSILYDDEFRAEKTAKHDDFQTRGRVERVFRAIDMISKYKAAYEDGADLSKSVIRDFGTIWYDCESNVLPRDLMHNLRQIEDELQKRSPESSPVKAFWMVQEIQRSKWSSAGPSTDHVHQDAPTVMDASTNLTEAVYSYDHNSRQLSYMPINQQYGSTYPHMADTGSNLQDQPQQSFGWFNQGAINVNFSTQDAQQLLTALNPMTNAFVPSTTNTSPPAPAQEVSTQNLSRTRPIDSSSETVTPVSSLTVAELIAQGQKAYHWQDRDDEYWPGDHIFIPTFCRPFQSWSAPQLIGQGFAEPKPDSDDQSKPTPESDSKSKSNLGPVDSGYASGSTPPVPHGDEADNQDAESDAAADADDEISYYEVPRRGHIYVIRHGDVDCPLDLSNDYAIPMESLGPISHRYLEEHPDILRELHTNGMRPEQETCESLYGSRSSVLTWLSGVGNDRWT